MELSRLIAQDLLKIKAVFFRPEEPFTWASGIKSPVYCDNRLILTAPEVRERVENRIAQAIRDAAAGGKGEIPVVCHRKSGEEWLVSLRLDDFLDLIKGAPNGHD